MFTINNNHENHCSLWLIDRWIDQFICTALNYAAFLGTLHMTFVNVIATFLFPAFCHSTIIKSYAANSLLYGKQFSQTLYIDFKHTFFKYPLHNFITNFPVNCTPIPPPLTFHQILTDEITPNTPLSTPWETLPYWPNASHFPPPCLQNTSVLSVLCWEHLQPPHHIIASSYMWVFHYWPWQTTSHRSGPTLPGPLSASFPCSLCLHSTSHAAVTHQT